VVENLGLHDGLLGVADFADIFPQYPKLTAMRAQGRLLQTGGGSGVNQELLLDLKPQLVLSVYYERSSLPALERAGIQSIPFGMEQERTPLASAEWLKLLAMLFEREKEGNRLFAGISSRYEALKARAAGTRPVKVLPARTSGDLWSRYAFDRRFVEDAGGRLVEPENAPERTFPYEYIVEHGLDAPVWPYANSRWKGLKDVVKADARLAEFSAVKNGRVYHNNAARTPGFANPYFTAVYFRPDEVLADLIRILHPELLPDHELVYFAKLN
jgi:iron complex transport system substrate-binding protein